MATKGAGMSDTLIIALIVLALILVSNVLVWTYARTPDTKAIEQAVAKERERLETDWNTYMKGKEQLLMQKNSELADLKRKHKRLIDALEERGAEAGSIKSPETNKELRERLTGLGYPPR